MAWTLLLTRGLLAGLFAAAAAAAEPHAPFAGRAQVEAALAAPPPVEAGLIEPPIVVAVDSGPDRVGGYTPRSSLFGSPPRRQGGGAAASGRFLAEELLPLIAQRYPIQTGPAATTVGGSSLGGLVSLWLPLHRSDVFGAALVVSPSLWWDNESALRDVLARPPGYPRPRLCLDMGGRESAQGIGQARRATTTRPPGPRG